MCTVSWLFSDNGYQLLFNRDELIVRKPGLPPAVRTFRGVDFIAPRDGDHGGSWIAVNEFGLSLCLLNRYRGDEESCSDPVSRGLLLWDLADSDSTIEGLARLSATDLSRFRPFTLAMFESGFGATKFEWSGRRAWTERLADAACPLTSSSYDSSAVARTRRVAYYRVISRTGMLDGESLLRFHSGHSPARGPYSTCMHRSDARTVSFSWITVRGDLAQFRYYGDSPCLAGAGDLETTRLSLRPRKAAMLPSPELEPLFDVSRPDSGNILRK